jgi:endo-1,4-beta-D-glucanase Y
MGGSGGGGTGGGGVGGVGGAGGMVTFTPSPPMHPFGKHGFTYPTGVLKPVGNLDGQVTKYYDMWKSTYLKQMCGGYVVLSEGGTGAKDGTFTVSEAHGYGMVITALMAGYDPQAQEIFNGLYAVFRAFPSWNTPDLMDWQLLTKCPTGSTCKEPVKGCFRIDGSDSGSATDGDMDIAFALLLADKQWGSKGAYLGEARKVIAAIKAKEMNASTKYPLLADDIMKGDDFFYTTRPSDFMLDHFRAFSKATGDAFWTQSVDALHGLIDGLQMREAATTGLIPDFVVATDTATPKPAPPKWPADEGDATGEYAYNSCRVPWRLTTDFVVSNDPRTRTEVAKINTWFKGWSNGNPHMVVDGYTLSGGISSSAAGTDLSFGAPFAVASILDTDQTWVDKSWAELFVEPKDHAYFGDTIKMISLIVISQNWWAPQ